MRDASSQKQTPINEPVLEYRPDSSETQSLKQELRSQLGQSIDIPAIINGREVRTGKTEKIIVPHDHKKVLGHYHKVSPKDVEAAIQGSLDAWKEWSFVSPSARAEIFVKAAELLAGKHRNALNAATMLGQSKTCHQAEIDAACETIDFWRFNAHFLKQMQEVQPIDGPGIRNRLEYRALEGFIFAVTPFNFTSIGGNLPTAPAYMGNVSLWKPASTAVYSGYFIMKILTEAGLPPGVIQFLPGSGAVIGDIVLKHPQLAGIHFTGSTGVFQQLWKTVGENITNYKTYPRLVGETGGKDFIFAHASADVDVLVTAMVRGAFEYQGQKCSAASRAYIPKSLWRDVKEKLVSELQTIRMGDVLDFSNFMSAVIDENSFNNIKSYIEEAKKSSDVEVVFGGNCNDEVGYFVEPTVLEAKTPNYRTMCEEIFGPVLTIYVYEDSKFEETLKICDQTSPYALTGAFLAQDKQMVEYATKILTHSAGNFYINTKPTGAVVGQQPFGGARASGTNDKAGSLWNLARWTSLRMVSETLTPPTNYRYPFLEKN